MDKFYSDRLPELLGLLPFKRSDQISQEQKNLACSTQKRFEQVLLELVQYAMDLVGSRNLVTAGGCALNGVANSRILRELNVSGHFIQPAASDDGTSLGAALAVKHMVYNDDSSSALHSPFLGPCSEEAAIQSLLENCPSEVRLFNSFDKTALETAKLLNQGLVVGWYQGRSEWGPRALGNRSILASPTHKDMKDIINKKIKRRESFRPFAPSVLEEDVGIFFEQAVSSPFMMHVVKFKDEMYEKFPSVVHVDGTGRVQTVTSDFNPKYYRLLQEIKKLTGFGILLNTSFNENEPIVSYAEEALDCFYRTDMDVLVLNNIIISK